MAQHRSSISECSVDADCDDGDPCTIDTCHLTDGCVNTPASNCQCADSPEGWYDIDGPTYDCEWYSQGSNCASYGDSYANEGLTANMACCVCGGGVNVPLAPPPTPDPSARPSNAPTPAYSASPTGNPTAYPSEGPTTSPSVPPSNTPTVAHSASPTATLTAAPIGNPTAFPSEGPTTSPSFSPSNAPTVALSDVPTGNPTNSPTDSPIASPTKGPTASPSTSPTASPTKPPTTSPTGNPAASPTDKPTNSPSASPSYSPTVARSDAPTGNPTTSPTGNPTVSPTKGPTASPTDSPTKVPTLAPNAEPVWETIGSNGFEKVDASGECDYNGWVDPDPDNKATLITNTWGNVHSGNCALRLMNDESTSMVTSEMFDVTTYDSLKVVFQYKPRRMTGSSEEFYLYISTDNGDTYALEHTWTNAVTESISNVSEFTNNVYQEGIVENIDVTDASDVSIRFVSNGDSKQSRVFLDDVVIEAT